MRETLELFTYERRARTFFVVLAQSALGTGAAYVALLLIALERLDSPWAISLILVADLLPAMLLGPLFGALADRWSRRGCAVLADAVRAVAFAGIGLAGSFELTILFALLAGAGTALFTPATLAALPSLVEERRLAAANAAYAGLADLGLTLGPAVAALLLLAGGPETIVHVNAVTFAISALLLARLQFGGAPERDARARRGPPSLLADAREGLRALSTFPGLRVVLLGSAAALLFGGMVNVAELPLVTEELGASDVAFSLIVAVAGAGFLAGSVVGSRGGPLALLKSRYLLGLALMGLGYLLSGLAPVYGLALATFALAGFGNALMIVHERLLIQNLVPDRLSARVFGVKDSLTAWSWGIAFLLAGALVSGLGARAVMVLTGAGVLVVASGAAVALGRVWREADVTVRGEGLRAGSALAGGSLGSSAGVGVSRYRDRRQDGADTVGSHDEWLAILDDLH